MPVVSWWPLRMLFQDNDGSLHEWQFRFQLDCFVRKLFSCSRKHSALYFTISLLHVNHIWVSYGHIFCANTKFRWGKQGHKSTKTLNGVGWVSMCVSQSEQNASVTQRASPTDRAMLSCVLFQINPMAAKLHLCVKYALYQIYAHEIKKIEKHASHSLCLQKSSISSLSTVFNSKTPKFWEIQSHTLHSRQRFTLVHVLLSCIALLYVDVIGRVSMSHTQLWISTVD